MNVDLFTSPIEALKPHVRLIQMDNLGTVSRCLMAIGELRFKRIQSLTDLITDEKTLKTHVAAAPIWEDPAGGFFEDQKALILEAIFQACCVTESASS